MWTTLGWNETAWGDRLCTATDGLGHTLNLRSLGGRMTVVIVSHDVGFVSSRIGKVVCVHGGVAVHATTELSGEMLREIYGRDVSLVRHDTSIQPVASPSAKEADRE